MLFAIGFLVHWGGPWFTFFSVFLLNEALVGRFTFFSGFLLNESLRGRHDFPPWFLVERVAMTFFSGFLLNENRCSPRCADPLPSMSWSFAAPYASRVTVSPRIHHPHGFNFSGQRGDAFPKT